MPESKGLIAGLYIQNPFWLKQLQETIFTWYIIFTLCKYLFLFRAERVAPWVACGIEFSFFFFGCLQRISGTSSCCWCWRRRRRHGQQGVATTSGRLAMFNWPQRQWKRGASLGSQSATSKMSCKCCHLN